VLSQVLCAKRRGFKGVIVPTPNAAEAAVVEESTFVRPTR